MITFCAGSTKPSNKEGGGGLERKRGERERERGREEERANI
jgi:hypothetical protein